MTDQLCMARTGLTESPGLGECRYHLCVEAPGHRSAGFTHGCSCGYRWTCLSGSIKDYDIQLKPRGEQ